LVAGQNGVQDAAMEGVFRAYFIEAQDIGQHSVLADCATVAGIDRDQTIAFLSGDFADKEMHAADKAAREAGVSGVPSFLDGYGLFSGAMPAETMANAFRQGNKVLAGAGGGIVSPSFLTISKARIFACSAGSARSKALIAASVESINDKAS